MTLSEMSSHATLIPVKNMDRAIKFYTEVLGGKATGRAEGEMEDFWASVKVSKSEFWLVSPEEKEKRELAYSVFLVKDIKAAVSELREKGAKFQKAEKTPDNRVEGPIAYDAVGAVAFFKDTEGNLLMLYQGA